MAETIEQDNDCSFRDFIDQNESGAGFLFQPVNVATVFKLITKLSSSKATGIDKISAKVLLTAAPAIARSLTKIFNVSITSEQFPSEWKAARVIPIFKLEIHACNNPSPVFKRCLLSAVASTSSQGVCDVR